MRSLTQYYKNLCEDLEKKIEILEAELQLAESSHKDEPKDGKKKKKPSQEKPAGDITAGMSPLIADFVKTMQKAYGNRGPK